MEDVTDCLPNNGKPTLTLEEKLAKYKNRLEFLRTIIGVLVLGIQIFVVIKLYSN
jgi:hypothetical protein